MKTRLLNCAMIFLAAFTLLGLSAQHSVIADLDSWSALAAANHVGQGPENQESEASAFHWNRVMPPGSTLEIRGLNGSIDASPASGDQVEVVAVKKWHKSDPSQVQIRVEESVHGFRICALYPDENGQRRDSCSEGNHNVRNNDVSVDFTARIPAMILFDGRTVNGGISARSLGSNVHARTVNGSVRISTMGLAEAETVNGSLDIAMSRADWANTLAFKTVNGSLKLALPASLSAKVKARTVSGNISSDFPLTVTEQHVGKHIDATLGNGERELIMNTVNGSISLRRLGE